MNSHEMEAVIPDDSAFGIAVPRPKEDMPGSVTPENWPVSESPNHPVGSASCGNHLSARQYEQAGRVGLLVQCRVSPQRPHAANVLILARSTAPSSDSLNGIASEVRDEELPRTFVGYEHAPVAELTNGRYLLEEVL
jgi:hypothetical protein